MLDPGSGFGCHAADGWWFVAALRGKPTSNALYMTWEMQSEAAASHEETMQLVVIDLVWWKEVSTWEENSVDGAIYTVQLQ